MLYNQTRIIVKKEKTHFRNCPSCDKKIGYTSAAGRDRAEAKGSLCKSCATTLDRTGKKHSAQAKANMSAAQTGKTLSSEHKSSISATRLKTSVAWTKMYGDKYKFSGFYFSDWSKSVKDRDSWKCQKCGKKKTTPMSIHAHHIIPSQYFMARALDVDNGISLCASCHGKVHRELDTYVLNGMKLSATDFQNHLKGFINTWPDQKTKQ